MIYHNVIGNGGYSDFRLSAGLDDLFSNQLLESLWRRLVKVMHLAGENEWAYLVSSIVVAIEAAPETGKRATRDSGSEKTRVLEQQKNVDELIAKAATVAGRLAKLLAEIEEAGGETPAESYSGLALIESAIKSVPMASACCSKHFEILKRGMSSYERHEFPSSRDIVSELSAALDNHQPCKLRFADDPWLKSSQSSWKDYVRVLRSNFDDMELMYGIQLSLSDAEWTALCQVMLGDQTLTRQVVSRGLKEL